MREECPLSLDEELELRKTDLLVQLVSTQPHLDGVRGGIAERATEELLVALTTTAVVFGTTPTSVPERICVVESPHLCRGGGASVAEVVFPNEARSESLSPRESEVGAATEVEPVLPDLLHRGRKRPDVSPWQPTGYADSVDVDFVDCPRMRVGGVEGVRFPHLIGNDLATYHPILVAMDGEEMRCTAHALSGAVAFGRAVAHGNSLETSRTGLSLNPHVQIGDSEPVSTATTVEGSIGLAVHVPRGRSFRGDEIVPRGVMVLEITTGRDGKLLSQSQERDGGIIDGGRSFLLWEEGTGARGRRRG